MENEEVIINPHDEPIVMGKGIFDLVYKEKNPSDLIGLYSFYYYTGKWQKTNQPYATDKYCKKGLKWGEVRFRAAKKKLLELNLIETVYNRDEKGKIEKKYTRVHFMWGREKVQKLENSTITRETHSMGSPTCGYQNTNALNDNRLNALNDDKEMLKTEDDVSIKEMPIDYESIKLQWNEVAKKYGHPKVISITKKRQDPLRTRLSEPLFDFEKILSEFDRSSFLQVPVNWLSFDWLIKNDTNYIKVLEGNYRNKFKKETSDEEIEEMYTR